MSEEQARRLVAMLTEKQKRDLLLMLTIMQEARSDQGEGSES